MNITPKQKELAIKQFEAVKAEVLPTAYSEEELTAIYETAINYIYELRNINSSWDLADVIAEAVEYVENEFNKSKEWTI